jgi:hypothetical protein
MVYYLPFVWKKKITKLSYPHNEKCFNTTENVFILAPSDFGKTKLARYFILIQLILSEVFVLSIVIIFNTLLLISLRKHICWSKKENKCLSINLSNPKKECDRGDIDGENDSFLKTNLSTQNRNKSIFRLSRMIISLSVLSLLGNTPIVVLYTISLFYTIDPVLNNNLVTLSNLSTVLTFTCFIFVYYYFNKLFRNTFKHLFSFKRKL